RNPGSFVRGCSSPRTQIVEVATDGSRRTITSSDAPTAKAYDGYGGSMVVDGSGNLFYIEGGSLMEITGATDAPTTGTPTPIVTDIGAAEGGEPSSVSVLGSDAYVAMDARETPGFVKEYDVSHAPVTLVNTIAFPDGGTIDGAEVDVHGNLIVTDA